MRLHGEWADQRLLSRLQTVEAPVALRECAHIRGAQETWLSRIEQRSATLPVWPELTLGELASAGPQVDAAWRAFFADLREDRLAMRVSYQSLAGEPFTTPLSDILMHVMLHGQYHRGKANASLGVAGAAIGVDYILWQRSHAPAAG